MLQQQISQPTPFEENRRIHSCGLVEDIIAEIGVKRILVKKHKYFNQAHEDNWIHRELAKVAACHLLGTPEIVTHIGNASIHQNIFPWDRQHWKPIQDYREALLEVGALLVAEIERIDRVTHRYQDDVSDLPAIIVNHAKGEAQIETEAASEPEPLPEPPMPQVLHREPLVTPNWPPAIDEPPPKGKFGAKIIRIKDWAKKGLLRGSEHFIEFREAFML